MPTNMIEEPEKSVAKQTIASDVREINLINKCSEVDRLYDFIMAFCKDHSISDKCAKSVCLALEEAVVNVINYAYPQDTQGNIFVHVEGGKDVISFIIKDSGVPFDPTKASEADVTSDVENRPIGGLGIFLIKSMMDRMEYQRTPDGFNLLRLEKKIS